MRTKIIPSIIAKSQTEFNRRYKKVSNLSPILHLDVMDGRFVPTKSLDFELELPRHSFEAHLMIKDPESWISENYKFAKTIIFHIEATKNPGKLIKLIKSKKRKVGIAINPKTPIKNLKPYLKSVDKVLFMTVYPGYYGAKFQSSVLKKISELRKANPRLAIGVDGSMNPKTLALAKEAGVNEFTVGSYLQKAEDVKKAFKRLK